MEELSRVTAATVDVLRELLTGGGGTWGLQIVKATGRPAGSVYPILARLEAAGWVASRWADDDTRGPRRRLYELSPDGAARATTLVGHREALEAAARAGRTHPSRPALS